MNMEVTQLVSALRVVDTPLPHARMGSFPLTTILEEAIRVIVEAAPHKGLSQPAPDAEPLAHLVRVLVAANHLCWPDGCGFLRLQLMRLETLMKEYPGDQASACLRLGCIFARALEVLGRADDETYRVPDIFRVGEIEPY
ncbi:MAG: hypothetical protein WA058_02710 [Minisyncoccia bacterium]